MKRKENMTMSEMINFDSEVVNFCNDNASYITLDESEKLTAEIFLNHYNALVEAANENENILSEQQKERFLEVAARLLEQGFVECAGIKTFEA